MYIISFASCVNQLTIGQQHIRETLEEAIDCAVELAVANGAVELRVEIKKELEADYDYLDASGEWGVFIGQPEPKE